MSDYTAPLREMRFVLHGLADLEGLGQLPGFEEATPETVDAILDEAARFAEGVLAPLNVPGDREGARWVDGEVFVAKGFGEAYRQFAENGWNGIGADPEYGGQGMPQIVVAAVNELWKSSNMAFSLCPLLTSGAIEAISLNASPEIKTRYLPGMVEGKWTGTMNLTEPQAGSDLSQVRTRAERQGDGSYRIFGQKIFITYGEHDMTENIIHLVLARLPDAPQGVKGISLFVVPKFLLNDDGSPGPRNDVNCVSIEHKLGIHASPTCVMAYGDRGGATGYLVGRENEGLKYMFVMMNAARFAVGLEGLAIGERAYQQALAYARERQQGRDLVDGSGPVPIIRHPDIRRMLMLMKSQIEAMRTLAYVVAAAIDRARCHPDAEERQRNQAFVDLMIPVVKGWSTETGIEIANLGIQIHGGVGFIEETGAAQYLRDGRITTIYEGTTGIQAMDLIGRKMAREGGASLQALVCQMKATESELAKQAGEEFAAIRQGLGEGIRAVTEAATHLIGEFDRDVRAAHVGAVPFLRLMGVVSGGWQMARAALLAQSRLATPSDADDFYRAKIGTACFFAEHVLSQAPGLAATVIRGGASALAVPEALF